MNKEAITVSQDITGYEFNNDVVLTVGTRISAVVRIMPGLNDQRKGAL